MSITATRATGLLLPAGPDNAPESYVVGPVGDWTRPTGPITSRIAYAAAHVVPQAWSDTAPGAPAVLDWDATLAYRHELWSYGLGVADAMDTAQRGMGLDWSATRELITRSGAEARAAGGALACGAGTDQLDLAALSGGSAGLAAILDAYREQIAVVSEAGATVILMASRALARIARGPEDYLRRLRHPAERGRAAGDPALARHHVRRRAGRVLGQPRHTKGHRRFHRADRLARGEGRRSEGVPVGRRSRDRAPPGTSGRRSALHRRRLQLPGTDPR